MTVHRVRLIFSTDFGEQLKALDLTVPTWIVGSPSNNPTIEDLWLSKAGNITRFDAQEFDSLIGTVDEHHPSWRELEVRGLARDRCQSALGTSEITPLSGLVARMSKSTRMTRFRH